MIILQLFSFLSFINTHIHCNYFSNDYIYAYFVITVTLSEVPGHVQLTVSGSTSQTRTIVSRFTWWSGTPNHLTVKCMSYPFILYRKMILKNEFLRLIIQRFYLLKKFFFLKQQKVYRQYRSPENSSNQWTHLSWSD